MTNLKIRVDSEARSCSEPINITQQCITFRQGRQGCDLIRDDVDVSLDRELDQLKMSQVCIQMKDEGCEIKPWSKFRVFWVKPVIRLENKSDYWPNVNSSLRKIAVKKRWLCRWLSIETDKAIFQSINIQIDEVTKGIKVTSLSAKKSGIKTSSVYQTRCQIDRD